MSDIINDKNNNNNINLKLTYMSSHVSSVRKSILKKLQDRTKHVFMNTLKISEIKTEMHWWNTMKKANSFNIEHSKMQVNIHNKLHRKIVESSIISNYKTINIQLFLIIILLI